MLEWWKSALRCSRMRFIYFLQQKTAPSVSPVLRMLPFSYLYQEHVASDVTHHCSGGRQNVCSYFGFQRGAMRNFSSFRVCRYSDTNPSLQQWKAERSVFFSVWARYSGTLYSSMLKSVIWSQASPLPWFLAERNLKVGLLATTTVEGKQLYFNFSSFFTLHSAPPWSSFLHKPLTNSSLQKKTQEAQITSNNWLIKLLNQQKLSKKS